MSDIGLLPPRLCVRMSGEMGDDNRISIHDEIFCFRRYSERQPTIVLQ